MKRASKIMLLVHPQMRPDRASPNGATESDVWRALKRLGHAPVVTPLRGDLKFFDAEIARQRPQIVFNLLEEFRGEGVFDFHPVAYLEALGVPYTGCNPRGLIVSRHKAWAGHIAHGVGALTPKVYGGVAEVRYPAFVKFAREHASFGLTEKNRVRTARELASVKSAMRRKYSGEITLQEFIAGEDVTVSILGNGRPAAFAPWKLSVGDANSFATEMIKFSARTRRRRGIRAVRYRGPGGNEMRAVALKLFSAFDLSGYARLDFRVSAGGRPYFIDVNANPNLARDEDFARAAKSAGMDYEEVIAKILKLARNYEPRV